MSTPPEGPICLDCGAAWQTGHKCQEREIVFITRCEKCGMQRMSGHPHICPDPLPEQYNPRTELVRQLLTIRTRIVASGGPLLTLEEINGEQPPAQRQPQTCATCKHKTPNLAHCDRYTLSLLQTPRGWGCTVGWEAMG